MLTVPLAFGFAGIVGWWVVITLIGRDVLLAATLPLLRTRGLTALPVTYIGKGATFALMSGFPLILLGQWDALWSRVILACGWAFVHLGSCAVSVVGSALPHPGRHGAAPDAEGTFAWLSQERADLRSPTAGPSAGTTPTPDEISTRPTRRR